MSRFYLIGLLALVFILSGCDFCPDGNGRSSETGNRIYFTTVSVNSDENTIFYYEESNNYYDSFLNGYSLSPNYSSQILLCTIVNEDGFYDLKYYDLSLDLLFDISNGDVEFPNLNANLSGDGKFLVFNDSDGVVYKTDLSNNFEILRNNSDVGFGLFISPDNSKILLKNNISGEYEVISVDGDLILSFTLPLRATESEISFAWEGDSDGLVFAESTEKGIFGNIDLDGQKKEFTLLNFHPTSCFYLSQSEIGLVSGGGGIFIFDISTQRLYELEAGGGYENARVEYNILENKLVVLQIDKDPRFSILWTSKLIDSKIVERKIISSGVVNFISKM